ncbi:MAG: response regulator, partial [Marmoricola sp.]
MDSTAQLGLLVGLADALDGASDPVGAVTAAMGPLRALAGAEIAVAIGPAAPGREPGQGRTTAHDGADLPIADLVGVDPDGSSLTACPVPESWREQGIGSVAALRLPGHVGVLVLAWAGPAGEDSPVLDLALRHLRTAADRAVSEESFLDLAARVDNAQQLANMGDYDWHIPTDTNRWSDQLYRIYGHEPQSFNASYERFLSLVHPDDRERVQGLHQHAYGTGEPWQVIERIIRPDGEIRHLLTNGEVVMGPDSVPERMRGTCIDVTERMLADQEKAQIATRFQSLVETAPDAILVLDSDHRIISCNPRAREMLGGDPREHPITEILPTWPETPDEAANGSGIDGRALVLDVIRAARHEDEGEHPFVALYLRDAKPRLASEAMATRLGEAHLRRRQALEINDNVVQGLVAASYALDQGQAESSRTYLDQTLYAARAMMDDLLEPLDGEGLRPGDLVRTTAATIGYPPDPAGSHQEDTIEQKQSHRVLVVDDAEDLRMLLRARMETRNGLTVVGEAADGLAAVELASELQPDLVMLDLAMPRMDGLEALPLIRAAVPGVRVIVLSGFNQSTLAEKAIEAGADRYVVKGGSMRKLLDL